MKSENFDNNQKSPHSARSSDLMKSLILKLVIFILIYFGVIFFVGFVIHPYAQARMDQFQTRIMDELVSGQDLGVPVSLDHPEMRELYQLPNGNRLGIVNLSLEFRKETVAILFDQQGTPLQLKPLTSHSVGRLDRFFPQGSISPDFLPVMGYRIGRLYQLFGVVRSIILQGAR